MDEKKNENPKIDFGIKKVLWPWIKDFVEVGLVVGAIVLLSHLILQPKMLIPLVDVSSASMVHTDDAWRNWLETQGVSDAEISEFPFSRGIDVGDIVVIKRADVELGDVVIYKRDLLHTRLGNEPIIHRVVGIVRIKDWKIEGIEGTLACLTQKQFYDEYIPYIRNCTLGHACVYPDHPQTGNFTFYITKGDNNPFVDQCSERQDNKIYMQISFPVTEEQLLAEGLVRIPKLGWPKLILNRFLRF